MYKCRQQLGCGPMRPLARFPGVVSQSYSINLFSIISIDNGIRIITKFWGISYPWQQDIWPRFVALCKIDKNQTLGYWVDPWPLRRSDDQGITVECSLFTSISFLISKLFYVFFFFFFQPCPPVCVRYYIVCSMSSFLFLVETGYT